MPPTLCVTSFSWRLYSIKNRFKLNPLRIFTMRRPEELAV